MDIAAVEARGDTGTVNLQTGGKNDDLRKMARHVSDILRAIPEFALGTTAAEKQNALRRVDESKPQRHFSLCGQSIFLKLLFLDREAPLIEEFQRPRMDQSVTPIPMPPV